MVIFEVEGLGFNTRQRINKLKRNGKSLINEFLEEIKKDKNLEPELGELYATLEDTANGKMVPKNQYRKLRLSSKIKYSAFEAKSKHLRLYLFHDENRKIIMIGGKKVDQERDIERLEKIIKEHTEYKRIQK
ncbi:MAG TPA: hypothetical protein VJY62_05000 [Bacteroidia bacterium]|nr:hypothetical protein [Bacteroidia bacterium]